MISEHSSTASDAKLGDVFWSAFDSERGTGFAAPQRPRRTTLADECVTSRHEASAPEMKRSNWCSRGGCFDAQTAMSALSRKYRLMSEIVISSNASRACLSCSIVQSGSSCAQHRGHMCQFASGVASVSVLNGYRNSIIRRPGGP